MKKIYRDAAESLRKTKKEYHKQYMRQYRRVNKEYREYIKQYNKKYCQSHRKQYNKYMRQYRMTHNSKPVNVTKGFAHAERLLSKFLQERRTFVSKKGYLDDLYKDLYKEIRKRE